MTTELKVENPYGEDEGDNVRVERDIQPASINLHAGAATTVEAQRALAQVQSMIVIAQQFPRNERKCMNDILEDCLNLNVVENAEYAYPRAGETVAGPSIRLAEVMALRWKHMDFGSMELDRSDGTSNMLSWAWDLQNNVRVAREFAVDHFIVLRNRKRKALTDPRDIYEHTQSHAQRRVRACLLAVLPRKVQDAAQAQCANTQMYKMGAPEEQIKTIIDRFVKLGVSEAEVKGRLGVPLNKVTGAHVLNLRRIAKSMEDQISKKSDWFETSETENQSLDEANKALQ